MSARVFAETRRVYRGGGRSWFTKRAAYRAAARAMIRRRCDCEKPEYDSHGITYPGSTCEWHADTERFLAVRNRLARWLQFCDRSSRPAPHEVTTC